MTGSSNTLPALQLAAVTVGYEPGQPVVADANFELQAGEIVVLLGASGCGKSTLLRAIAGLEPVQSGRILMSGEDVTDVPTHRRGCGMVFQDAQLFANRSVARNIAYGLEVQRVPECERRRRVTELLELVGLPQVGERQVSQLSGGQAQRVALARALAPRPRIMLLDEPFSALDRALRERLSVEVRDILRGQGTAAVHVTHDWEEARTVGDRIVEIRDRVLHPQTA
ncbi:ABC transporter ATP-binding protein [uncultured Gulosibacter sp.]|uniref:ABC transporter ATP-binding protein n=1 Tax=uncultured Gulosibacter sp. TaxID=1339167 RepID=UPI00288B60C1|nr:ABC transporter ATP-binding protein [uncultured Gulosibacter sp.]